MLNTINTKKRQLENGTYQIGSGPTIILLVGSCRVLPYANYFDYLNTRNQFTIHLVNLVNLHFDLADKMVDHHAVIGELSTMGHIRDIIKNAKVYIHEHCDNFDMFNPSLSSPVNIWQFGMNPEHDITLPNFNDLFIMFQDLVTFDPAIREMAVKDKAVIGQMSVQTQAYIADRGMAAVKKFCDICRMGSLPEFADIFENTWKTIRYFWTSNHISNAFTIEVMRLMNEKFLKLGIPQSFWDRAKKEDLYASPRSPITQYDVDNYGLKWPQPVEQLIIP